MEQIDLQRNFSFGITSIPELHFSPSELDFPRAIAENQYHMNPISLTRKEVGYDYCFKLQIEDIKSVAKSKNWPIVYCSLGSRNVLQYKRCKYFLQKVINAFATLPCELIISVGESIESTAFRSVHSNVHIFQTVPQYALLKTVDIMITHGGLQSLQECIIHEVPMIVYPLTSKWDQCGNAARIVYHGLGLRGNIKYEAEKGLQKKVRILLEDQQVKDRLKRMKALLLKQSDPVKTLETFDALFNLPRDSKQNISLKKTPEKVMEY